MKTEPSPYSRIVMMRAETRSLIEEVERRKTDDRNFGLSLSELLQIMQVEPDRRTTQ